jgi:hypothetical protein
MDINRNVLFPNKCYSIKSLVIPMDRRWEPGGAGSGFCPYEI